MYTKASTNKLLSDVEEVHEILVVVVRMVCFYSRDGSDNSTRDGGVEEIQVIFFKHSNAVARTSSTVNENESIHLAKSRLRQSERATGLSS